MSTVPTITAGRAGSTRRLANRPRVVVVVLVPANARLDVLRRNQPNLVTEPPQLARPVMRARASLHPYHARRHVRKVPPDLTAPEDLAKQHLPPSVTAHHVKHVLCQVQANRRKARPWSPPLVRRWLVEFPSWRIRRRCSKREETISSTYLLRRASFESGAFLGLLAGTRPGRFPTPAAAGIPVELRTARSSRPRRLRW